MLRLDSGQWAIASVLLVLALSGCDRGGDPALSIQVPETPPPVAPPTPPPPACVSLVSIPPAPLAVVSPGSPPGLSAATSARFSGSGTCAACHRTDLSTTPATNVDLVNGEPVGIANDWAGTMMANAARDPYYLATVTAEIGVVPAYSAAIQAKCLTCHAPMASYEARASGATFGLAQLYVSELGLDGVSCLLCHRIEPGGLGTDASFSGGFEVGDQVGSARPVYGPFADVVATPMVNRIGFNPLHGAHLTESRMCATCHTLRTEAVDPVSGQFSGTIFPEQMPYKEWLYSSHVATASCQTCHLPLARGSVRLSSFGPTRGLAPFGRHHLVGGNIYMLGLMKQDRTGANTLGLVADAGNLDASMVRTGNALSQATATLDASVCGGAAALTLDVTVRNLTGHKLPSGFPNRRAWLHVRVLDTTGATVFESGAVDAGSEIVGLDAGFEPHYEVIDRPDQVQVYEAVMADLYNRPTSRLLHAARYIKDNRLLPDGMSSDVADVEIRPVGVGMDADFGNGRDRLRYVVATTGFRAPFRFSVELLYQAIPPRPVAALAAFASPEIDRFMSLYGAASNAPRRIASVQATLN